MDLRVTVSLGPLRPSSQETCTLEEGVALAEEGGLPPEGQSHSCSEEGRPKATPPDSPASFSSMGGCPAPPSGKPGTMGTRTSGQHVAALPPPPVTQPPQALLDTMCWLGRGGGAAGPAPEVDTNVSGYPGGLGSALCLLLSHRSPRFCHQASSPSEIPHQPLAFPLGPLERL